MLAALWVSNFKAEPGTRGLAKTVVFLDLVSSKGINIFSFSGLSLHHALLLILVYLLKLFLEIMSY